MGKDTDIIDGLIDVLQSPNKDPLSPVSDGLRQKSTHSLRQRSTGYPARLLSQRSYGSQRSNISVESTGVVHGFLHFPLGTKTGPASLRGAKIDCIDTFVPFGGPDPILLMPTRKDAAKLPLDPKLAAVEEGWDGSMVPGKSISALFKKLMYASATDCVNPETLKTAHEARERTRLYNEMLDQKRAEILPRIQREEHMQKHNLRRIQKMKEAEERRLAEIERGKRKQIALQEEIECDIEDRQLMLDKIQREHAALYNSTQPLPTMYGRRISFARSIGHITQDVSGCSNCGSLACSDQNCGKPAAMMAKKSSGAHGRK